MTAPFDRTPFDPVRIAITYATGATFATPIMDRWLADWIMANEIALGYYKGRRVASARIVAV
jgi:hypothetical protein